MTVRSALGQPLYVVIEVLEPTAATAADCFSVGASPGATVPPPRARFSLERSGERTLLHLRTAAPVGDPVAQFTLISDCEARLQRDYVVLLDPPALSPSVPLRAPAAPVAQPLTAPPPVADKPERSKPVARSAPRKSRQEAPAAARESSASRGSDAASIDMAPRLVLSGRRGVGEGALALRLDTSLPDLNRPRAASLTPDEISDENTALTRKLAHLESQLVALQKRNAAIEAKRGGAGAASPPESVTDAIPRWPLYLLLAGLVLAAVTLVILMRRGRSRTPDSLDTKSVPLVASDPMASDAWDLAGSGAAARASPERTVDPEDMRDYIPSAGPAPTTVVKDDILDQAEVYMAHGHGDLAIHLLQEHLREAPDESPIPWLLLLDLLHRENDTEGYATASVACRQHFNVNLSGHPISQDSDTSEGLEAYPHLLDQLVVVWGTALTEAFFIDLIYDKRGGTRIGFEPGAYRDILLLRAIAQEVHPTPA